MFTPTNTNTTTIMKTFNNLEDQIFDIIEKKSNIEMAWMPTRHIAKLCHIIGFRTSIDEVESILGKLLFEQKIILQFNDNGEELFFIA